MKKIFSVFILLFIAVLYTGNAYSFWGSKYTEVKPENGVLKIPVADIDDGLAHYFSAKADDGIKTRFFLLKSSDGVIRAAIDACDVCYRSGKGYEQQGDYMVCMNCGQKFASSRINDVKGGCNPAPLDRVTENGFVTITMAAINKNSWYCEFK